MGISSVTGCMATGRKQTDTSKRELSSVSVTTSDDSPFLIEPNIEQRDINQEQTAEFILTITWNGNKSRGLTFGNQVPFSSPNYSSERSGLVLLPADTTIERKNKQTWVPETYSDGGIASNSSLVTGKFEPGESLSGSWGVWADPKNASRVEPGTYRFENQIGLYEDLTSDDTEDIDWLLRLKIVEA